MAFFIACDIDHTLLNDKGNLLEENVTALKKAQALGAVVVLSTARSFSGALPIHQALKLKTPLVVSNGTLVCEPNGNVLKAQTIKTETAEEVVTLFGDGVHHWSFRTPEAAFVHPEFDTAAPPFNDPKAYRKTALESLLESLDNYSKLITATLFGYELLPVYGAHNWTGKGLTADYYPPSHFTRYEALSVMSQDANKGTAVAWLRRYMGMENNPTLTIGDSPADATMFPLGIGVAPANAQPEVLAAADWIAPHCDEGAVAAAIERFILLERVPS